MSILFSYLSQDLLVHYLSIPDRGEYIIYLSKSEGVSIWLALLNKSGGMRILFITVKSEVHANWSGKKNHCSHIVKIVKNTTDLYLIIPNRECLKCKWWPKQIGTVRLADVFINFVQITHLLSFVMDCKPD